MVPNPFLIRKPTPNGYAAPSCRNGAIPDTPSPAITFTMLLFSFTKVSNNKHPNATSPSERFEDGNVGVPIIGAGHNVVHGIPSIRTLLDIELLPWAEKGLNILTQVH